MKKTFRELIVDGLKPGEIWENKDQKVSRIYLNEYGNLQLEGEDNSFAQNYSTCIGLEAIYELQRKEYTFAEAFKSYEEGIEVESKITGFKYKKVDGKDLAEVSYGWDDFDYLEICEIRGSWYINN